MLGVARGKQRRRQVLEIRLAHRYVVARQRVAQPVGQRVMPRIIEVQLVGPPIGGRQNVCHVLPVDVHLPLRQRLGGDLHRVLAALPRKRSAATSRANCTSGWTNTFLRLPKTACLVNWPTASPAALPTSSTSTVPITFATRLAPPRWRPSVRQWRDW